MPDTIKLSTKNGDFEVECEPCDVAPHLPGYEFAVHRDFSFPDEWAVSERSTGMKVPDSESFSQLGAIDYAAEVLSQLTPEQFEKAMAKARKILAERAA